MTLTLIWTGDCPTSVDNPLANIYCRWKLQLGRFSIHNNYLIWLRDPYSIGGQARLAKLQQYTNNVGAVSEDDCLLLH